MSSLPALSPVAVQPSLCQTLSENPKAGFLVTQVLYNVTLPFTEYKELNKLLKFTVFTLTVTTFTTGWQGPQNSVAFNFLNFKALLKALRWGPHLW